MTTIDDYLSRKLSKETLYPIYGTRPINLLYDKQFYGRVDKSQNAVYVSDTSKLGQLVSPSDSEPLFALDFVANAFNDFRRHFNKAASFGRLNESNNIKTIKAVKGFVDINESYGEYIDSFFIDFDLFLAATRTNQNVVVFSDYLIEFISYMFERADKFPITRTKFIKSRLCSVANSGLSVDVSLVAPTVENKRTWVRDPNFDFYRNAAALFGFMIDEDMPWRLIADVSSRETQAYWVDVKEPTSDDINAGRRSGLSDKEIISMFRIESPRNGLIYKPGDASNLFKKYYTKSHLTDAEEMRNNLIKYFNRFVQINPDRVQVTHSKCPPSTGGALGEGHFKLKKITTKREPITIDQVSDMYSMTYWMQLCFLTRVLEEKINVPINKFDMIKKRSKYILEKQLDFFGAMSYLNSQIIKIKSSHRGRECQNYVSCATAIKKGKQLTTTSAGIIADDSADL